MHFVNTFQFPECHVFIDLLLTKLLFSLGPKLGEKTVQCWNLIHRSGSYIYII